MLCKLKCCFLRCEKAEQEVINLRNNEDYDLEENSYGDNSAVNDFSSSNTLQRRSSTTVRNSQRSGKVVTDLEKFGMKPSDGVKKAVNFIDTWALLTGR